MSASARRSPTRGRGEAPRIWRSSSRLPGSGSRTRGSRCGSFAGRSCLPGEDLREGLDVDLVENAAALRLLQPRDELRAQDVDLAVQDAPAVRDLLLFLRVLVDQTFEVGVGQCRKVRQGFHAHLVFEGSR